MARVPSLPSHAAQHAPHRRSSGGYAVRCAGGADGRRRPRDVRVRSVADPTPPHPMRRPAPAGLPHCAVPPRLSSRSFGVRFLWYTLPRSAAVSTDRNDTAASNGVRHPHCFVFAVWFALVLTGTGRLDPMAPGTLGPKLNYRRVLPSTHVAHAQSRPALRTHRRLRWLGFS